MPTIFYWLTVSVISHTKSQIFAEARFLNVGICSFTLIYDKQAICDVNCIISRLIDKWLQPYTTLTLFLYYTNTVIQFSGLPHMLKISNCNYFDRNLQLQYYLWLLRMNIFVVQVSFSLKNLKTMMMQRLLGSVLSQHIFLHLENKICRSVHLCSATCSFVTHFTFNKKWKLLAIRILYLATLQFWLFCF